ncbi:MAG: hypothetical protein WBO70_05500 [Erysipelotrichaceae bacterium]
MKSVTGNILIESLLIMMLVGYVVVISTVIIKSWHQLDISIEYTIEDIISEE